MTSIKRSRFASLGTGVLSFVGATLLCAGSANPSQGQNSPWNQPQQSQKTDLPETKKLEQNDNLDPTVNRTQAMRTEAETGTVAPITGQPLTSKKQSPPPKKIPGNKRIYREY